MIFVGIVLGLIINHVLGSVVLGFYDTDTSLFEWATSCPILPNLTFILIVQLWPLMLIADLVARRFHD